MFNDLDLNVEEKETLVNSISWITILIAGADGEIDKEELEWAKKITGIRAYKYPEVLENFYSTVGTDFQQKVDTLVSTLPKDVKERTEVLSNKLSTLNPILAKLDNHIAHAYYQSFTSFAEHIAKSHGGFLRFFSVSLEEKKLLSLPMITSIIREVSE